MKKTFLKNIYQNPFTKKPFTQYAVYLHSSKVSHMLNFNILNFT